MTSLPADRETALRGEERVATTLPVWLTMRLGPEAYEVIPALLMDLSTSGVSLLTDLRFSPLLPPAPGTHFEIEFFFDDIEVCRTEVTLERLDKRSAHQVVLGCSFVALSGELRATIRHKVAALLATTPLFFRQSKA
jgi:hypothetical protein